MANFKERDMKNVTANLVGEVKTASFDWDGETINVTNFSLVEKKNGKRHYTNCAAYGEWSEVAKELKAGDLVHVFGYIRERRNNDKLYKNFIVKHMNKIEKENKEEKYYGIFYRRNSGFKNFSYCNWCRFRGMGSN